MRGLDVHCRSRERCGELLGGLVHFYKGVGHDNNYIGRLYTTLYSSLQVSNNPQSITS